MGLCASKGGELEHDDGSNLDVTSFRCSSLGLSGRFRSLSFDSPRNSADVGEVGSLSALFYKRGSRRCPHGDISFASYLTAPLMKGLDMQGLDAIAKSYAEAAAKAAARDTFIFLEENDHGQSGELDVPLTFPTAETAVVDVKEEDSEGNEETVSVDAASNQGGAISPVVADSGERSSLECFPASSRWASVVNAARQSACLAARPVRLRKLIGGKKHEENIYGAPITGRKPEQSRGGEDNYSSQPGKAFVDSAQDAGNSSLNAIMCTEKICVGYCGGEEEAETSDRLTIGLSERFPRLHKIVGESAGDLEGAQCKDPGSSLSCADPSLDLGLNGSISLSIPAHVPSPAEEGSLARGPKVIDSEADKFFSFPSSPTAKAFEEMGSGHIIEEMKVAKMMEEIEMGRSMAKNKALEWPQDSGAESLRGENASSSAFGSPISVRVKKPRLGLNSTFKFFSLERASTAAVSKKTSVREKVANTDESSGQAPQTFSSNNPDIRRDIFDEDDSSSDLFEIENIQGMRIMGFTGLDFPCLQIKKSFAPKDATEVSGGGVSAATSDPGVVRNYVRGSKAVLAANSKAKLLRDQAIQKAKITGKVQDSTGQIAKGVQQSKGLALVKLGLLRRKHLTVQNMAAHEESLSTQLTPSSEHFEPVELENKPPSNGWEPAVHTGSSTKKPSGKSEKRSFRQVLERQIFNGM